MVFTISLQEHILNLPNSIRMIEIHWAQGDDEDDEYYK